MTTLDELLREVLTDDAAAQPQPADLADRSMRLGRRIRHRRKVGAASVALASVVAIVGGSIAIADAVGHQQAVQTISPAAQPLARVPAWRTWPKHRVFGTSPGAFGGAPASSIYASGTMPDGMEFLVWGTGDPKMPISDVNGWNGTPIFGDNPGAGSPQYRAHAPYFAMESMTFATWDHGLEDHGSGQWLIVVGQPGTTSASYSADGTSWQAMQIQNGIAVIKLPGIAPRTAKVQLSDAAGQYAGGPLEIL